MKKLFLSLLVLCLFLLQGCSGQSKEKLVEEYTKIMDSINTADSYSMALNVNIAASLSGETMTMNSESKIEVQDYNSDPKMFIDTLLTQDGEEVYDATLWYKNDEAYISSLGNKYTLPMSFDDVKDEYNDELNAYGKLSVDMIDSIEKSKDGDYSIYKISFSQNGEEYLNRLLAATVLDLNGTGATMEIHEGNIELRADKNNYPVDYTAHIDADITIDSNTVNFVIDFAGEYSKINETSIVFPNPEDYSLVTGNNDEESSTITTKEEYIDWLTNSNTYVLQDDGTYLQDLGDTETYRYDFANNTYTYSYKGNSYALDFLYMIGKNEGCEYSIYDKEILNDSDCSAEQVKEIEYTKTALDYDLNYADAELEVLTEN